MVKVRGWAKINLLLNIVGLSNKMHLIDGVFIPFNLCDNIIIDSRTDNEIFVSYTDKNLKFDNDTAMKMAKAIKLRYGTKGVDILIDKKIPQKSGLGGSSADAAAVARGMQELFCLEEIDTKLLLSVGSDVPYMYQGGTRRVSGLGENTSAVSLPTMYKIVLLPKLGVDTAECYRLYDEVGGDNSDIDEFLRQPKLVTKFTNALERAACLLNKDIEAALELLKKAGFCYGMSGSGSACFGIAYDKSEFEKKKAKLLALNDNRFVVLQEEKE